MKHVQTCGVKAHQVSWCCSAKTSNDKDIIQTGYHGLQLAIADKMCGLEGWITRRMAFHVAAVQRSAMTKGYMKLTACSVAMQRTCAELKCGSRQMGVHDAAVQRPAVPRQLRARKTLMSKCSYLLFACACQSASLSPFTCWPKHCTSPKYLITGKAHLQISSSDCSLQLLAQLAPDWVLLLLLLEALLGCCWLKANCSRCSSSDWRLAVHWVGDHTKRDSTSR